MHLFQHDRNYDYAHTLLCECVTRDPGNLSYVEALLENLNARSKSKRKRLLRRAPPAIHPMKKAAATEQWPTVLRHGLDAISQDPWHVPTLHLMAEACAQLHLPEVELAYLKQALNADPKNIEVNRHCARSLARMGQFDQSIACWHRIETICGKDQEAAEMISKLAEEKLLYPGGRPPGRAASQDPSPIELDDEKPVGMDNDSARPVQLSPRQTLEQALQQDPANVENYFALAELYCDLEQFDLAERTLTRAHANCAQTSAIERRLEDIRKRHAEFASSLAEKERVKKAQLEKKPFRMPWLELLLVVAGIALLLQFVPGAWSRLGSFLVDHARLLIFLANVLFVLTLVLVRNWRQQQK